MPCPRTLSGSRGIRQIRDAGLLQYVVDMSATPIYLAQSNPRPFDWIVSDYSLIDAIEAGLTKIPRVPTSTNPVERVGPQGHFQQDGLDSRPGTSGRT